jgi:hypothetical protein
MTLAAIAGLPQCHREKRSDDAIESHGFAAGVVALDGHASLAMTA